MSAEGGGLTRRGLLRRGLATAAALGLGQAAACSGGDSTGETGSSSTFTGTLRVTGILADLTDDAKLEAEKNLGFKLAFDALDVGPLRRLILTQPESFDVASSYYAFVDELWPSGNLRPVDTSRITRWDEITPLFKLGKVDPGDPSCTYGDGDAPFRRLYVDPERGGLVQWADEASGQGNGEEPRFCAGVPSMLGLDSLGYNADVLRKEPSEVSWAELFNTQWKGRVALWDDASAGPEVAGTAARALGLMELGDLGHLTKEEVDGLVKVLLELKRQGQFRAFWNDFDPQIELMMSGEVVVEQQWTIIPIFLQTLGAPVRSAVPPEGFRGWAGALSISSNVTDPATLQACYDYINWWYSGQAGAFFMPWGYYTAVQETSRQYVEPGYYAYWIEGKPADKDYPSYLVPDALSPRQGRVRDGGSFQQRACRFSVWYSSPADPEYQAQRWQELVSA